VSDPSKRANPESGTAPAGSKWGPARNSPDEPDDAGPGAAEQPDASEHGNFGEGLGVEAPSLETSRDVPGANRGG
jgi:hypothetical protein